MNYDSKAMIAKLEQLKPYLGRDTFYFKDTGYWIGGDLTNVWDALKYHLTKKTTAASVVMQSANRVWQRLRDEGRIK